MGKADNAALTLPAPAPVTGMPCAAKAGARAAAQRERILAAAQKCFIDHGFHAASMATIAATAQMSAGLMYRYFPSKNAIVLAIIDRQLQEARAKIAELHASADIVSGLCRSFEQWRTGDPAAMSVALFLAMGADARRDPQIAAALRASDRLTRADLMAWLGADTADGGCSLAREVVESRAILLQCVVEGLLMRAVREPDLDIHRLGPALRQLIDRLLAP